MSFKEANVEYHSRLSDQIREMTVIKATVRFTAQKYECECVHIQRSINKFGLLKTNDKINRYRK